MLKRYSYWAMSGSLASRTAEEMSGVALLLFAFASTSGAESAAVVFGSLTISAALGGPLLGVWLDRATTGRPQALALAAYGSGLLGCAVALDSGRATAAAALALCAGLAGPAVSGGWSGMLARSPTGAGRRIATFDASTYSIAGLAGPAIVGGAYVLVDPLAPLAITLGLLALGSACALAAGTSTNAGLPAHPVRDLVNGARAISRDAVLGTATLSSCIAFVGIGAFLTVVPALGEQHFGTAGLGTVLLLLSALVSLGATAWIDRRDALRLPIRVLIPATATAGIGLAIAAAPTPTAVIVGAVLVGLGDGPQLAALIQLRHDRAPQRLITQIFTTGASLKITAAGIGAYLAGALGPANTTEVLLLAASTHLVAAILLTRIPRPR